MIHRDDLLAVLSAQTNRAGVQVLFDKTVVSLDIERAAVSCSDGTHVLADLIIGADGNDLATSCGLALTWFRKGSIPQSAS